MKPHWLGKGSNDTWTARTRLPKVPRLGERGFEKSYPGLIRFAASRVAVRKPALKSKRFQLLPQAFV